MENAKQKAIRLAYVNLIGEEKYNQIKNQIDENGFIEFNKMPIFPKNTILEFKTKYFTDIFPNDVCKTLGRPKALSGIETNNNWVRIESEKDLPSDEKDYYVFNKLGNIFIYPYQTKGDVSIKEVWLNELTHYQPIIKPLKPIY